MLNSLIKKVKTFYQDTTGVTAIEYGLIAVAVTIAVIIILYGNPNGYISAVMVKMDQLTSLVKSVTLTP